MPIYEFYCDLCNVILNFFSSRVNTTTIPDCPKCGKKGLSKRVSKFATLKKTKEEEGEDQFAGLDESKMERAFESLMSEAGNINEEDPKQVATLMRKFTDQTGIRFGDSMEEALTRMEAGEDPEQVEQEMGDLINEEDFTIEGAKKRLLKAKQEPLHDDKLYEL